MSSSATESDESGVTWRDVCEWAARGRFDGFHVDTDEWGRILMTPVTFTHGALACRIAKLLDDAMDGGIVVCEVGVRTRKGVKAPDVMWTSAARVAERTDEYDDERAGEICVEVLSESNHPREIEEKRRLYFEQGASEVWICAVDGSMRFWCGAGAETPVSTLAPGFPSRISID